jgi:hypothetical protein
MDFEKLNTSVTPINSAHLMSNGTHTVTGAFGFMCKYITKVVLEKGMDVITLTNSPGGI